MSVTLVFMLSLLLGLALWLLGTALLNPPPGKTPLILSSVTFFVGFFVVLILGLTGTNAG